ncbi:ethanolamine ammonia-lyase reactivating factor EutA [Enterococcus faecalis]|jgi:ethanolamine utilization protein EutA|uniref:Ethanolamine ammonia-lyase reactivating factor EutA n=1 Tax=Enterococcus faecalis TaxID=1351 RepID=A0A8B3RX91_ENTFL|nr:MULTISPECIES: ethanolamine ammonia-lyase reactivating factor EutA [Enterococcus]EGO2580478.1 ethanolamine ammonia-lyase reactivating factor EutA [Enterococcus faecalis]EGO2696990.1 ethanolamine ammonia-lyase reactivating factor EutA [Enterococcus faecalis]EGO2699683.1 ethanolamine ammonia-lyase reactivating factor EutA [Enterococcus faecalis]EGO2733474.1 ethanolamine ammonia-lyase reactivating factor EutA [Enterococcus faecalis]EGO2799047.1 ethanolamine ammonia-lyase reactivating factor Eut
MQKEASQAMSKETLLTVGIDLGTSTTQLVLSELTVENFASAFTVPRISISDKKVIYRSDIIFTPLLNQSEIDAEPIKAFVAEQYRQAGIHKQDIQMGAVIITGETARKSNANNVLRALSGYAGDFVVATAGPDLESIIAGKGAGAQTYSETKRRPVVNLDIGGGTTNLAVFKDGEVIDTACFDIGGRLIKLDQQQKITYIAPKIQEIINKKGLTLHLGDQATEQNLLPIISELVAVLENSIGLGTQSPFYQLLVTNHPLRKGEELPIVTFSGGVADCLNTTSTNLFKYGDIGLLLGKYLRKSLIFSEKEVLESAETIRATVVGAGSHTAEISGSTIAYREQILPVKNIPILKLAQEDETLTVTELGQRIQEKLNWHRIEETPQIALAIRGMSNPTFADIQRYGQGIVEGLASLVAEQIPIIVMVDEDMAKALGHALSAHLPKDYPFICLDSVKVENGDYVDIGLPVAEGAVLPVIVKTLVFN